MGQNTKELIKKFNIRLTKSLGQNFLIDDNIVNRIVDTADIGLNDCVVEIGPGVGSMTLELARRAGRVIAVEIDKYLIPALEDNLKDFTNVRVINMDILKVNLEDIIGMEYNGRIKVVANLPYYITTPIIMKLLETGYGFERMVFMVQKEVALRMAAAPGGKDYGSLSVAVQYYSNPKIVFDVAPHCFIPQPDVDSSVIRLDINKTPPVELISKDMFFKIVRASFGQRRKTMVNALYNLANLNKSKEEIKETLKKLGIDEKARGESLSINQFAELSNTFSI